jgi:hypothetical protein
MSEVVAFCGDATAGIYNIKCNNEPHKKLWTMSNKLLVDAESKERRNKQQSTK